MEKTPSAPWNARAKIIRPIATRRATPWAMNNRPAPMTDRESCTPFLEHGDWQKREERAFHETQTDRPENFVIPFAPYNGRRDSMTVARGPRDPSAFWNRRAAIGENPSISRVLARERVDGCPGVQPLREITGGGGGSIFSAK
ncbi:uncharacterized protein N7459_003248 [Penicillium hispanicum]|uniref:uncharacterized protein n=1 Tax=Penicillium hispanicum TaxID=1080232 RepID=UPI002540DA18|nr:uncharacterized protein N7459_003248 [Penicillium hispanicum]KAJ5587483.1 hypothetical protein N7459_003248 [Penicillium hispanicum]